MIQDATDKQNMLMARLALNQEPSQVSVIHYFYIALQALKKLTQIIQRLSMRQYKIEDHKHRYAVWAASRAASVKGCRFSVEQGKSILEGANLHKLVDKPDKLPAIGKIDGEHNKWRESIIAEASKLSLLFTHGVAAKLLNIYLKTIFTCGGHHKHSRVLNLHPPIDEVLLKCLRDNDVGQLQAEWRRALRIRWSKLSSDEYQTVIENMRSAVQGRPLWTIEQCWQGHQ